jgi:two-component system response regulator QseB
MARLARAMQELCMMSAKARRWRVLLIEDDPALGAATCDVLRHLGLNVDWVVSANDAFASLAHEHDFDAVLLDLGLGSSDGVSLIKALKEDGHRLPPLLVLSARPSEALQRAARITGAVAILAKPCSADDLNRALQRVLSPPSKT